MQVVDCLLADPEYCASLELFEGLMRDITNKTTNPHIDARTQKINTQNMGTSALDSAIRALVRGVAPKIGELCHRGLNYHQNDKEWVTVLCPYKTLSCGKYNACSIYYQLLHL